MMSLSGLPAIGPTLVSARSFEEYLAMFNLDDADLTGRVLDCPGGAASFAAEAGACGVDVLAVDPVYAADHTWLGEHGKSEALRGNRHTASCLDAFSWTFFTDIDDHRRRRLQAACVFADDLAQRPERYLAAALPQLPLADRSIDLVLSSHLLFMYADRLDAAFHAAAAAEMLRVTRREVRIFPLVADSGEPVKHLIEAVVEVATARGASAERVPSRYEFQRGGDELLILTPPTSVDVQGL